jgi:D-alanyl-D-alanine carboxypeptidase
MPDLFAVIFAERLRGAGVSVAGTRRIGIDERYEGAPIGPAIFTPIATAITRCNRDSQNLYAECLLKRMGGARRPAPRLAGDRSRDRRARHPGPLSAPVRRVALHERRGVS